MRRRRSYFGQVLERITGLCSGLIAFSNGGKRRRERFTSVLCALERYRVALLVAVVLLTPGLVAAESFQATPRGFVLQHGKEFVRFDRGVFTAGMQGGKTVSWFLFLWHDQWLYETLHGGKIEAGPTLNADGAMEMKGTFSTRQGAAPLKYAYHIAPVAQGVRVRCELEKTGPLKLSNGVWMHLSADAKAFSGEERVWLDPSWNGPLAGHATGNATRFLIELDRPRSLCLEGLNYREINKEAKSLYRINLLRRDFEPGTKETVEFAIGFADMPDRFPGQIEPMQAALHLGKVTPNATEIPQYGRLELNVELAARYKNPFDPDEVRLDAVFTSPSGKECRVPGFFMLPCQRKTVEQAEVMLPEGRGQWKVRFTPRETGRHAWRLTLRDKSGEIVGGEGAFQAGAPLAANAGFVRVSPADSHYLAFASGKGFFPIGHNLPIYHTSGQLGDVAMRKFAAAKENYNRWWMSAGGFGIEWDSHLGWYRQPAAARIDLVLDLAAQLGLYYMLCMDTHQDFREHGWNANPFNAANGGPCKTAGEWFTDETARNYYKKRLRYTVARWGYSPNVLCWEFGNEFEGWANSSKEIQLAWHREMSDYLRALDPFGHLITTSFWTNTGPEEFWNLKNLDIVQTHCYTNDDANVADRVRLYCRHQWRHFEKPHLFGEFGIRSHATTADKDPQGWGIHNSLWAGLANFTAGGVMPWWHENYLDTLDLYFHFTSLANFTEGLPLGTARWQPLVTAPAEYIDKNRKPETRDVAIIPVGGWERSQQNEFTISPAGLTSDDPIPQRMLHGAGHRDLKNPPTFVVTYPQPGRFIVHVGRVSASGLLRIELDGRQVLEKPLPCDKGLGKTSVFRPQWKIWETVYEEDIAVDVPAGAHRIRVDNVGRDWVEVTRYAMTGCRVVDRPEVQAMGMKTAGLAILWIQNHDSCWYNHAVGKVSTVDPFTVCVEGLRDGPCRIEWWETWKGVPMKQETGQVQDGKLVLVFRDLKTDTAVKIRAGQSE